MEIKGKFYFDFLNKNFFFFYKDKFDMGPRWSLMELEIFLRSYFHFFFFILIIKISSNMN